MLMTNQNLSTLSTINILHRLPRDLKISDEIRSYIKDSLDITNLYITESKNNTDEDILRYVNNLYTIILLLDNNIDLTKYIYFEHLIKLLTYIENDLYSEIKREILKKTSMLFMTVYDNSIEYNSSQIGCIKQFKVLAKKFLDSIFCYSTSNNDTHYRLKLADLYHDFSNETIFPELKIILLKREDYCRNIKHKEQENISTSFPSFFNKSKQYKFNEPNYKIAMNHKILSDKSFHSNNEKSFLIKKDLNASDEIYDIICSGKGINLINKLISKGADINYKKRGWSLIHWSARYARHEAIKILLSFGVDLEIKDGRQLTPLAVAVRYYTKNDDDEAYKTVKILLENGADPNQIINNDYFHIYHNFTLFHLALYRAVKSNSIGQIRLVRLFRNKKYNTNENLQLSLQPCHLGFPIEKSVANLVEIYYIDAVKIDKFYKLTRYDIDESYIEKAFKAVSNDNENKLINLVQMFPEIIYCYDNNNHNLLHRSVLSGNINIFNILFKKYDTSVNYIYDREGRSILLSAAYAGHTDILYKILSSNPELLEQKDKKGNDVFLIASFCGHIDMLNQLLRDYKDIGLYSRNNSRWNVLQIAAYSPSVKSIKFLLKAHHWDIADLEEALVISKEYKKLSLNCKDDYLHKRFKIYDAIEDILQLAIDSRNLDSSQNKLKLLKL